MRFAWELTFDYLSSSIGQVPKASWGGIRYNTGCASGCIDGAIADHSLLPTPKTQRVESGAATAVQQQWFTPR